MGLTKQQLDYTTNPQTIKKQMETNSQLLIVRQSQLQRSLEFYTLIDVKPTPAELVKTAELFKDFVYNGPTTDVINRAKNLETYLQDKTKISNALEETLKY